MNDEFHHQEKHTSGPYKPHARFHMVAHMISWNEQAARVLLISLESEPLPDSASFVLSTLVHVYSPATLLLIAVAAVLHSR